MKKHITSAKKTFGLLHLKYEQVMSTVNFWDFVLLGNNFQKHKKFTILQTEKLVG
jgi:hypothetical protein